MNKDKTPVLRNGAKCRKCGEKKEWFHKIGYVVCGKCGKIKTSNK